MRRNKAHDISTYAFKKDEPLLLNTNVRLYLFAGPCSYDKAHALKYSAALKRIKSAGSRLVMDAMVLSEYLNTYCRIEWMALHRGAYPRFKEFRQSPDFKPVSETAAIFAKEILKLCTRHNHPFETMDMPQVLSDFEAGTYDTNDGLIKDHSSFNPSDDYMVQRPWSVYS